jgi:predicted ribosomally synthesized peptide with SipW-like signal peptide
VAIVVVVVVAVLILTGLATLAWFTANERFTCPGVAWTIDYVGAGSGYFGTDPPTGCLGYPVTGPMGYEITILLTLTNTAPSVSHQIASITAAYPTSMNSISPALPITVTPGGSASLTLNVTIPTLTGDYVVQGVITTS